MAEKATVTGQVMDIKFKYTCPKSRGNYKGGGGAQAASSTSKRKKVGGGPSDIEWVKVITSEGRTRWETRPRVKRH